MLEQIGFCSLVYVDNVTSLGNGELRNETSCHVKQILTSYRILPMAKCLGKYIKIFLDYFQVYFLFLFQILMAY